MSKASRKPARARTSAGTTKQRASAASAGAARKTVPRVVRITATGARTASRAAAARLLGLKDTRTDRVVARLRAGLPYAALERLSRASGISVLELARLADIPVRTLSRRKTQGELGAAESERVLRLSNLYAQALRLFDDDSGAATRWLTTPKTGLGGSIPLDFAATEVGAREVEELIGRLEHGVYS
jgi:putative toxin-antitoxin system antitoxin component (TIGR02293 family)